MELRGFSLYLFLLLTVGVCVLADIQTDYMTETCNTNLGLRTTGRFETSTSLTYSSLMDCYTSVSVAAGKMIMMYFYRFEVEDKLEGICLDYFNAHDGGSVSSSIIHTSPLCGVWSTTDGLTNMTTTSNQVTFYFTTDNTAVYRGFEIIYVAYSWAPCRSSEFACNNSMCIDGSLRCDDVTQCGDGSDEEGCEELEEEKDDEFPWDIVIGCSVAGLVLLLIIAYAIYRAYDYYKWRNWLARNRSKRFPWQEKDDIYEYPVTDKYSKFEIGHKGRREPDVSPYFAYQNPEALTADETGRYLDEN